MSDVTYQPALTMLFRLSIEMPRWMAAEIACLSEEQAAEVLVAAYRMYFSSEVELPLSSRKTWQEETLAALGMYFKAHRIEKPQLPVLPNKKTAPVTLLRAKGMGR